MIRLYMDENVDGAITRELRKRGIDVLTVQEDGREGIADPTVLDRAGELGRILFSRDDDLIAEVVRRTRRGDTSFGVIYAHKSAVTLGQCISDLEYLALAGTEEDFADRIHHLPLLRGI